LADALQSFPERIEKREDRVTGSQDDDLVGVLKKNVPTLSWMGPNLTRSPCQIWEAIAR
jgi:hypothetical protein